MGMPVTELEQRMTVEELVDHAADYRLQAQEAAKARDKAKRAANRKRGRL